LPVKFAHAENETASTRPAAMATPNIRLLTVSSARNAGPKADRLME
jgi:hypothetical protein